MQELNLVMEIITMSDNDLSREELETFMMKQNVGQETLASALGVSSGAVNHWLWGRRKVPPTVARIIRYFDANNIHITELK